MATRLLGGALSWILFAVVLIIGAAFADAKHSHIVIESSTPAFHHQHPHHVNNGNVVREEHERTKVEINRRPKKHLPISSSSTASSEEASGEGRHRIRHTNITITKGGKKPVQKPAKDQESVYKILPDEVHSNTIVEESDKEKPSRPHEKHRETSQESDDDKEIILEMDDNPSSSSSSHHHHHNHHHSSKHCRGHRHRNCEHTHRHDNHHCSRHEKLHKRKAQKETKNSNSLEEIPLSESKEF